MTDRILFVDDEPDLLDGLRRTLRRRYTFDTAAGGAEGLKRLAVGEPYAVIVSDMRMPRMNGTEFLRRAQEAAPEAVRVMLTGQTDLGTAIDALHEGRVFRFLTKPVSTEALAEVIDAAIAQHNLIVAEQRYLNTIKSHNEELEQAVAERTKELADSRFDIIWCLARAAEERDDMTGFHVRRVAAYSSVIARQLALPESFIETLTLASPLHDVGKIGIPDAILNKPGKFTPAERAVMNKHCEIGAKILHPQAETAALFDVWIANSRSGEAGRERTASPILEMASRIAYTHHERWDGRGYPQGLTGEAIPLESRIVALADVYDALRSARPYKPALPEQRVLHMIREEAAASFDPTVYEAFRDALPQIRMLGERLSDGYPPLKLSA